MTTQRTMILLTCLLWLATLASTGHVQMTRGPLLSNPDNLTSTMTLVWWTDVPGDSTVQYGPTPALGFITQDGPGLRHEVTLRGLLADTTYFYSLQTNGQTLLSGKTFHTPPESDTTRSITFAVIGDFGGPASQSQAHREIVNQMVRQNPELILTVGDNAYRDGTQSEIDNNWLKVWAPLLPTTPLYPSFGNHDLRTLEGRPMEETFVLPHNNPANTEKYYSFDYGNIHFVILNSSQKRDPLQKRWLEQDLASTRQPWVFVFFHHPPYSSGEFGDPEIRTMWGYLLEEYADAVFTGHDHNYQRSRWIDDFAADGLLGANGKGTYYFVTGGGGYKTFRTARSGRRRFNAVALRTYQFMAVTVTGLRATFKAIGRDGRVLDTFEIVQ